MFWTSSDFLDYCSIDWRGYCSEGRAPLERGKPSGSEVIHYWLNADEGSGVTGIGKIDLWQREFWEVLRPKNALKKLTLDLSKEN